MHHSISPKTEPERFQAERLKFLKARRDRIAQHWPRDPRLPWMDRAVASAFKSVVAECGLDEARKMLAA